MALAPSSIVPTGHMYGGSRQRFNPSDLLLAVFTPLVAFVAEKDHPGYGVVAVRVPRVDSLLQFGVVVVPRRGPEPDLLELDDLTPYQIASQLARALRLHAITKHVELEKPIGVSIGYVSRDVETGLAVRMVAVYDPSLDGFVIRFDVAGER